MIDDIPIGAALNRDIARGEATEKELARIIERRSRQKDPDEESEMWKASVRAYEQKSWRMSRLECHAFHCGRAARQRATLHELVEHNEEQAAKLMKDQPKGAG